MFLCLSTASCLFIYFFGTFWFFFFFLSEPKFISSSVWHSYGCFTWCYVHDAFQYAGLLMKSMELLTGESLMQIHGLVLHFNTWNMEAHKLRGCISGQPCLQRKTCRGATVRLWPLSQHQLAFADCSPATNTLSTGGKCILNIDCFISLCCS